MVQTDLKLWRTLQRAASRLVGMPGLCRRFAGRREKSRRGAHECARHVALAALISCGAWAQSPVFEAASVKPSPPPGPTMTMWMKGGPGSGDPTRIDYHNASLNNILATAYQVADWQISGPDWIRTEHYEIVAKVPPDATKEQFRQMLANLLVERFKLQVHRETKQMPIYSITAAKGGSKLRPHVDTPPEANDDGPPARRSGPPQADGEGFPILTGKVGGAGFGNKHASRWNNAGVDQLLGMIEGELKSPVQDSTGLTGKYDIDLHWVSRNYWINGQEQDVGDGPDIIAALRMQLGLNLEKTKGPAEILVIDRLEEVPTGN